MEQLNFRPCILKTNKFYSTLKFAEIGQRGLNFKEISFSCPIGDADCLLKGP